MGFADTESEEGVGVSLVVETLRIPVMGTADVPVVLVAEDDDAVLSDGTATGGCVGLRQMMRATTIITIRPRVSVAMISDFLFIL